MYVLGIDDLFQIRLHVFEHNVDIFKLFHGSWPDDFNQLDDVLVVEKLFKKKYSEA